MSILYCTMEEIDRIEFTNSNLDTILENMWNILSPYSELLDWEIKYNTIIHNNTSYKIAESFFGDKIVTPITKNDIILFLDKIAILQDKLKQIEYDVIQKLQNKPLTLQLFQDSFFELENKIKLLKIAVYSEAVKWWYKLTAQELEIYNSSIKDSLTVFGNSVSENLDEVQFILGKVFQDIDKEQRKNIKNRNITDEELSILKDSVNFIKHETWYSLTQNKKIIVWIKIDKNISSIEKKDQIELYTSMMENEFNDNNILSYNWKIITHNSWNSSVDQRKEEFKIPSEEKQSTINLATALWTYTHEFGKHVVSAYNTNKFLWKGFKWANYLETEEWLASIFTGLASWKVSSLNDLSKLIEKPTIWDICILISEHYNLKDTLKIINIYKQLIWSKLNIEDLVYRRKRFIHPDFKWASPKDMAYTRWKNKVIYYLQSFNSEEEILNAVHDLNTFKLNIKDRYLLPWLKKELNIEEDCLMKSNFIGLLIAQQLGIWLQWLKENTLWFDILTKNISDNTKKTALDIIQTFNLKKN